MPKAPLSPKEKTKEDAKSRYYSRYIFPFHLLVNSRFASVIAIALIVVNGGQKNFVLGFPFVVFDCVVFIAMLYLAKYSWHTRDAENLQHLNCLDMAMIENFPEQVFQISQRMYRNDVTTEEFHGDVVYRRYSCIIKNIYTRYLDDREKQERKSFYSTRR